MIEIPMTSTTAQKWPTGVRVWRGEGESQYAEVKHWAPLIEESITPLSPGLHRASGAIVTAQGVTVFDSSLQGRYSGVSVVDPAYVAFVLPVSHEGEYVLNGLTIPVTGIYMLARSVPLYIHGRGRRTLGILLPADRFVETVAALTGVANDSIKLSSGLLGLSTATAQATLYRLLAIQTMTCAQATGTTGRQWSEHVFAVIVDAFLSAQSSSDAGRGRSMRLASVVRRAEDRFMAANGARISLADLCQAAGVGSTALYEGFARVCGESPLAYLRKRQLTRARLALLTESERQRGAVKRAALSAGLTHLGRFSAEYRELFGESPSTTLSNARG